MFYRTGPKQQHEPAREYILKGYLACNPDPDRMCYSHFTAATGTLSTRDKVLFYSQHQIIIT